MVYLMKCGHVSNAIQHLPDRTTRPVCAICIGIKKEAAEIVHECKDDAGLEDRKAKCTNCEKETNSCWDLAFFKYQPENAHDSYYCGCRGWD